MSDTFDKSSTLKIDGEVLNRSSFMKTTSETLARRVGNTADTPLNVSDVCSLFNPLAMPLLTWTRIIEVLTSEATTELPKGLYFVNDSFVQFAIISNSEVGHDLDLRENNILLLNELTALELDATNGTTRFAITDIFLELE